MKKVLIIFILALIGVGAQAQFNSKPVKFRTYNLHGNSMTILKSDNLANVTIMVPPDATDSTSVIGDTLTFKGIPSTALKLGPGESISFGYSDMLRINKLVISAADKARVIQIPIKD